MRSLFIILFCFVSIYTQAQTLKGTASFYASKFNGRRAADGSIFSNSGLTCACNRLPLGSTVRVTNLKNGKSVTLKVTDRLAANNKRLVDLTQRAARDLGFYNAGLTQVSVEVIGKKKSEKKVEQDLEEIGKDSTHTISSDSIR